MSNYYPEQANALALEATREAQEAIRQLENLLIADLDADTVVDWDKQKSSEPFPEAPPEAVVPQAPTATPIPREPCWSDETYRSRGLWETIRVFPKWYVPEKFDRDHEAWQRLRADLELQNARLEEQYKRDIEQSKSRAAVEHRAWRDRQQAHYQAQKEDHERVDRLKDEYQSGTPDVVGGYCELVLRQAHYAKPFPLRSQCQYVADTRMLVVDYQLPDKECFPSLKEVRYIRARNEFREYRLSEAALNRLFDDTIYKIVLRSIHRLYRADAIGAVDSIVLNGWVKAIDKGTGQYVTGCILSIQTNKKEFLGINLAQVDGKECFRRLKGVGSSTLHGLSAVQPILTISREDRRFVPSREVIGSLGDSKNIAAMPWEDFEHLIRELFEKEFTQSGGEVKVTQASRDGGVDAVAFDPDPIRGGKIVIQAKRYTNVVGLSAVRDLYGTVINEGATKGILITTAEYRKDSYEFAKGKPLTLLNGGHLLHLLQRHGYRTRIDLKEAKKMQEERKGVGGETSL